MKLFEYIRKDLILTDLEAANKADVYRRLIHLFKETGLIQDEEALFRSIMAREDIMTTAVGKGLAVPHGLSGEIDGMAIAVAKLRKPLDFQALDQQPVKIIFMIVVNAERTDLSLKALAGISRMVRHTSFLPELESTKAPDEVVAVIRESEGQIAHH